MIAFHNENSSRSPFLGQPPQVVGV